MRNVILTLAVIFVSSSAFGQGSSEVMGGKAGGAAATTTKPATKPVTKPPANRDRASYSPCGVYYKNRADMIGESNLADRWFSLGESANKHFWYNPHKTTCDAKTAVLKSWLKEDHKASDGDYALVLYEFKCRTKQLRVKTVIEYDKSGSVLETTNHEDDPWQEAAPGTAGEVMLRTVCRQP